MTRKELICDTARKIIVENGFYDASISKIAKAAHIPVGSVYTYFESKEQLINEIFVAVKQEMGEYIFTPFTETLPGKEELKIYWQRAVDFGLANQEKFFFAEQFANSPLIKASNKEEVRQNFEKVFSLLENGIQKGILKSMDLFVLHNIIYTNIVGTIKYFSQQESKLTKTEKDQLFECCWDSIKI